MNADLLLKYWPLAAFLLNLIAVWVLWSMRHAFASKADLQKASERLDALDGRVALIEERERLGPQAEDLAELVKKMADLHGDYRALAATITAQGERMSGMMAELSRISSYLLQGAKR